MASQRDTPRDLQTPATVRFVRCDSAIHVTLDGDYLLCGFCAFDSCESEGENGIRWHDTDKQRVTCERCALIITACKGIKVGATLRQWSNR